MPISKVLLLVLLSATASPLIALDWRLAVKETKVHFPADLGSETIDVSDYPDDQKVTYRLFLQKCSVCHTPARAINSPIITAKDWKHYISLMHTRSGKGFLWPEDRKWLREFLVYDAQVRKIDHRASFLKQQKDLQERFKKIRKEDL